jgi:hypothetical protein
MLLSPCRFNAPLTDNEGQPIDPQVIVDLHRELLGQFGGFTIHPTSQGRWQSRAGRVYKEEVVVYEVAIPGDKVTQLRDVVCRLGRRLGQLAMYFDAPSPSVEIIDCLARRIRRPGLEVAVMNQDRTKQLVAEAKEIARRVDSWISLSNALSDPVGGLIARYFPTPEQREEFLRSPAYEELNQLLLRTIKRKGLYPRVAQGPNGVSS